jgi:hypothetical protein
MNSKPGQRYKVRTSFILKMEAVYFAETKQISKRGRSMNESGSIFNKSYFTCGH